METTLSARRIFVLAGFFILAVAELCLGLLWASGRLMAFEFFVGHVAIVGLMLVVWITGRDLRLLLVPIGFVVVAFAGPLGAAGWLLLAVMVWFSKPESAHVDAWYERISSSTARDEDLVRFQNIVSGRARGGRHSTVRHFKTVIVSGDLKDKQSLLGIVALKYHRDFFTVLKIALRDKEPLVRVQAAAVFAKLRARFKSRLKAALARVEDVGFGNGGELAKSTELYACIKSGFLDKSEIANARGAIKSMCAGVANGESEFEVQLMLCDVLFDEGLYDEVICRLRPYVGRNDARAGALLSKALVLCRRFDELSYLKQAGTISDSPAGSVARL